MIKMKARSRISIIVPVYNVEKYINQCIQSVLSQDYPEFELIIIDDGSTDRTLEICNQYLYNSHINVFSQEHGGQAKARNLGIQMASGDYIAFLDGDDFWEENYLDRLDKIINKSNCDLCIGNKYYCLKNGSKVMYQEFDMENEWCVDSLERVKDIIFYEGSIPGSMCLTIYNRSFLLKHNIMFSEDLICNEDFDFFIRGVLSAQSISLIGYCFYNYRQDNILSTYYNISSDKLLTYMRVYKKWFDYLKNKSEQEYKNILLGISKNYRWIFGARNSLDKNDKKIQEVTDFLQSTHYILDYSEKKTFITTIKRIKKYILFGRLKRE